MSKYVDSFTSKLLNCFYFLIIGHVDNLLGMYSQIGFLVNRGCNSFHIYEKIVVEKDLRVGGVVRIVICLGKP